MDYQTLNQLIAIRLKNLRVRRQLSLDRLSEQTGVSKPALAKIETGASNPTVSTLWKIAKGLDVPFTTFVSDDTADIQVAKERDTPPLIENDGKYIVYPVFPMTGSQPFEMYTVQLLPGCDYWSHPHQSGVRETIWVYQGSLTTKIQNESIVTDAQEGVSFRADCPHAYINNNPECTQLLMTIHYPNF